MHVPANGLRYLLLETLSAAIAVLICRCLPSHFIGYAGV
jgi:hypothetical protein